MPVRVIKFTIVNDRSVARANFLQTPDLDRILPLFKAALQTLMFRQSLFFSVLTFFCILTNTNSRSLIA